MNPFNEVKANLAFTCVHEQIPAASAETDELFQYARWLQKNNLLKQDKAVYAEIERLYRIATENGHYKANINLQNGAMRGQFRLRGAEYLRLSQQLIDAGVPTGYYFIGILLKSGAAGLKQDLEMSLRYFRKAADQGNAQAQYHIGEKLDSISSVREIAIQMYRCAAEQGNGEAAVTLGIYLKNRGRYREATEAFQMGVLAGNDSAAGRLGDGFAGPPATDKLYYLGQQEDLERADRYKKIWRILARNSYASPTVPEINEILPLPPAKLPDWDGKLQWVEARLANIPPKKPSEALIQQLAKAKLLEPATGRAMPGSTAFIKAESPAPICASGQPCPQTGYWQAIGISEKLPLTFRNGAIRRFEKNEIMPTLSVEHSKSRFLLADIVTVKEENIDWRLLGDA